MGRVTRAKAAEMRSHNGDNATLDINSSSSHEATAGVELPHLPLHDMHTKEQEFTNTGTASAEEAQSAATPVIDDIMQNTLQSGNTPTRLSTSPRNRDSPGTGALAEDNMATSFSPSKSANYDQLEAAAIQSQTPPREGRTSSISDSIAALDDMDEAVDLINAEVPDVQASPQKSKAKKAPIVRTTKAAQARISLAHAPKDSQRRTSSWGKPPAQVNGQRVVSTSSNKSSGDAAPRKEVEIPHSKPRPISMSFPTPPPPPKSTRAPTTSNFQLPGEAVAAKLKAAKEARLQREADEQKKKVFKARPAPSMTKAPSVRQTSTSKARESLMNGGPLTSSTGLKRANTVTSSRSSTSSSGPQTAKTNTSSKPSASNRLSLAPASTVQTTKRPSTAMALSTNRARPGSAVLSKPAAAARPASRATTKGKEVFSRPAQAKAAAEQEKRLKEEAAKKARAEAAERTRQQSREWAEKQRLKKLGPKSKENVAPIETADTQPEISPIEIVAQ